MSYGVEVYGPNGNVVWSDGIRATNIQVFQTFNLSAQSSLYVPCPDANDGSKVIITFISSNFSPIASFTGAIITNKTSSGFTLTKSGSYSPSGTVVAVRIS
jgi:hypothetical protein